MAFQSAPVAKPRVRWGRLLTVAVAITVGLLVAWMIWLGAATRREERLMDEAEQWCRETQSTLNADPRFVKIRLGVPKRYFAFSPPSWFIAVNGVVLDEPTEAELRAAVQRARPPRDASWSLLNCFGDGVLFDELH